MTDDAVLDRLRTELEHTQVWVRAVEYVAKQMLAADPSLKARIAAQAAADTRLSQSVKDAIAAMVANVPER